MLQTDEENMNKRIPAFDPLRRHSLPVLVQGRLEEMILKGNLPPGSQLTEIPLASQFGVSRGPVREAFRGLEERRLVRVESNRGVFVRTISPLEADQIYEVRIALELLVVARLAADPGRLAAAKLDVLLDKAERLAGKGDFAGCHTCNIEFHDRLVQATGNATLQDTYRRLVGELSLFRHRAHARIRDASSLRASVADHRAILAAVMAGDGPTARRRIRRHVEASRSRTQRLLAADGAGQD
jgi:DNA-binding GntR family transcriptional regulator